MRRIDHASLADWQDTHLWKYLFRSDISEAEDVRTALKGMLPDIQILLSAAGTSPTDFTLHDSQHAFRVAQRMFEIIPEDVFNALSVYELALLLLSSYLHDIGMSPQQQLVLQHYDFLITGDASNLSHEQISEFQNWLDAQGVELPMEVEALNTERLGKARLLITRYCRERHVDWGVAWIRRTLSNQRLGSYTHWLDDLCTLCRSHHGDYQFLVQDALDARPVGRYAYIVNLRYLACVLRVADILEFDPERTPEIVFRQRDIAAGSVLYWYKDHAFTLLIDKKKRLTVSARPSNAKTHRAIVDMVVDIEHELSLVQRLKDERRLQVAKFQEEPLLHRWEILPSIRLDVKPYDEAYEYIDGTFRPDTQRLLELLSGLELYGDAIVAVRELLQNAFDAVREQIAFERLMRPEPASEHWNSILGDIHFVDVSLRIESGEMWLTCQDSGAGMSKMIILNNLLVSGNSDRQEIRRLERNAKEVGFSLVRTAKFGIGVMSYFMIADLVQIRTKRSSIAEETEGNGWFFETEGVSSFGELRRDSTWKQGTEVRLRIRPALRDKISLELERYLLNLLLYTPCKVRVTHLHGTITIGQGWSSAPLQDLFSDEEIAEMTQSSSSSDDPPDERQVRKLLDNIQWKQFEGELPGNLGKYRLSIPLFSTPYSYSPILFIERVEPHGSIEGISLLPIRYRHHSIQPAGSFILSWRGMAVSLKDLDSNEELKDSILEVGAYGVLQLDLQNSRAGRITVTREVVELSEEAVSGLPHILDHVRFEVQELFWGNIESPLLLFWSLYARQLKSAIDANVWLSRNPCSEQFARVGQIRFPAVDHEYFYLEYFLNGYCLRWREKPVSIIDHLHLGSGVRIGRSTYSHHYGYSWCETSGLQPDRLVEVKSAIGPLHATLLWDSNSAVAVRLYMGGYRCRYPAAWAHVACSILPKYTTNVSELVWNASHPLAALQAETGDEQWVTQALGGEDITLFDPRSLGDSLFERRGRILAWFALFLCSNRGPFDDESYLQTKKGFWLTLSQDRGFIDKLWQTIFGLEGESSDRHVYCVEFQNKTAGNTRCWGISPTAFTYIRNMIELRELVPEPDLDYIIYVDDL